MSTPDTPPPKAQPPPKPLVKPAAKPRPPPPGMKLPPATLPTLPKPISDSNIAVGGIPPPLKFDNVALPPPPSAFDLPPPPNISDIPPEAFNMELPPPPLPIAPDSHREIEPEEPEEPEVPLPSPRTQNNAATLIQTVLRMWKARKDYKILYEKRRWTLHTKGTTLTNHVTRNRVAAKPGRRPPTRGKRPVGLEEPTYPPPRIVLDEPEGDSPPSDEPDQPPPPPKAPSIRLGGAPAFDPTAVTLKKVQSAVTDQPTAAQENQSSLANQFASLRANLRPTSTIIPKTTASFALGGAEPDSMNRSSPAVLPPKAPPPPGPGLPPLPPPPPPGGRGPPPPPPAMPKRSNSMEALTSPKSLGPSTPVPASPAPTISPVPPLESTPSKPEPTDSPSRAPLSPRASKAAQKKNRITRVLNNFLVKRPPPSELVERGLLHEDVTGGHGPHPSVSATHAPTASTHHEHSHAPTALHSSGGSHIQAHDGSPRVERKTCANATCNKPLKKSKIICKLCNDLFCKHCATKKIPIPELGCLKPVAICDKCYDERPAGLKPSENQKTFKGKSRREKKK